MGKQTIQNQWGILISETLRNKPNVKGAYPSNIVKNRELLLLGQVELARIESGNNQKFHARIYRSIMDRYFQQKNG
ncbi:hypothetical protein A3K73_01760 [Candidatus Pacearchaeota archaeon RBG_13_36_9]|nr:MAG: hypothetical protein A3K73_01760 [Candidatus Pacearchaeota archaeon RBG_13_36_9]